MTKKRYGFKPGQSGNPAGRREGSRNKASLMAEKLMEGDTEGVIRAVIEKAKDGDMQAAKLILDRVVPLRKGRPIQIALPDMGDSTDVVKALSAMLQAVATGELSPEEAQSVASIIETQRRAIETLELETRIAELERDSK